MLPSLFSALAAASKFLPALWTSFPVRVRGACPSLAAAPAVRPAGLPLPLCCSGPARSPVPGAGSRPSGGECGVRAARPPSLHPPRPKGTPRWLSAPLSQPRGAGHLASAWRGVRRTNCHCPPCPLPQWASPRSFLWPPASGHVFYREKVRDR